MSTILQARELCKTYKTSSGDVPALRDVNLDLEAGIFYAITGRSGSGKSTLLHALSGLDRPTGGKVTVDGADLYAFSDDRMSAFRRRTMGFVFQQYNLLEDYNVKANICMPLKLDGRKPDESFFEEVTQALGIQGKLRKYPGELSGGEQQRAAIARCVLAKPKLIFADEPTGNLDSRTGDETMHLLTACAARYGQTLIVVTHNPEIVKMADRVIRIADGIVTQE